MSSCCLQILTVWIMLMLLAWALTCKGLRAASGLWLRLCLLQCTWMAASHCPRHRQLPMPVAGGSFDLTALQAGR